MNVQHKTFTRRVGPALLAIAALLARAPGLAQKPDDASVLSSPIAPLPVGSSVPLGTTLSIRLTDAADSGKVKNGDIVHGVLTSPVKTTRGSTLPAGPPAEAPVVASARAGTIASYGVLSLQLVRVGGVPVITDVTDFNGQEGHKDVPDAAPAKGTEAQVAAGTELNFTVLEVGPATGLDLAGAEKARSEGTVGSGGPMNRQQQPTPQNTSTGPPNTAPGVNQSAGKGTATPH